MASPMGLWIEKTSRSGPYGENVQIVINRLAPREEREKERKNRTILVNLYMLLYDRKYIRADMRSETLEIR
jgi:hypothetical protein